MVTVFRQLNTYGASSSSASVDVSSAAVDVRSASVDVSRASADISRASADVSHIVRSPFPSIKVPEESFAEFYFSTTKQYGDFTALMDHLSGQQWTFRQLREAAVRVASGLRRLGLGQGDTLLVFAFNGPDFALLFLACAAAGIVVSSANPMYTVEELSRQIQMSGCTAIAAGEDLSPVVRAALHLDHTLKEKVKFRKIVLGKAEGFLPFSTLLEDDGKAFPENLDFRPREDTLALQYSSGTTGLPKGVMLTHTNFSVNMLQDQGHTVFILPRFDPHHFLSAISTHRIDTLHLVPPLLLFLVNDPRVLQRDISSVQKVLCGAAPVGEGISQLFAARSDAVLLQTFGTTESLFTHMDSPPVRHGTVGHLISSTEAKIVDVITGEDLPAGQTGELYVRGPQVMKGYLDNPQATQQTVVDGWLRTGDLGHYDEDGRFSITDRLKELIKYKGFQVSPAELEALLLTHPAVGDVAVVGMADPQAGELPTAFIVPKPGATFFKDDLLNFLHSKVAPHKKLRGGVKVVDSIPKSPSGKILHRVLKQSLSP
ncbi:hypothetical protein ACOMHN_032527 [Nucella lapillus]